jgi:hypothetical protein
MHWLLCFTCFAALCLPRVTHAQGIVVIKGEVRDTGGNKVSQATVRLQDSLGLVPMAFAITRGDGSFQLRVQVSQPMEFMLTAEHVQFSPYREKIHLNPGESHALSLPVILAPLVKSMQEVVIRADPPKFSVRGDTVEFRASAYRNGETRKVEDLLRNMQGFDVTADGKISFNGKEVDRILIEGEDLTEQQYQLLSRNLGAGIVDKVQVIQRYDPNRLSTGITRSDKVGINLKIDPKALKRWTGSWELGLGSNARRMTDLNLIRLAPSFKLIQFLQHNNTGQPANADMHHYFSKEGTPSANASGPVFSRGLVQTGQIIPPSLGHAYTRNNNDFSGFTIGAWKVGKAMRMKILAGAADTRLMFRSRGRQEVFPPDGDSWRLLSADTAESRDLQAILRLNLSHDGGKKNLGTVTMDLLGSRADHAYHNHTAGGVMDRLLESLRTAGRIFRFSAEESFLLDKSMLLKVAVNGRRERVEQLFQVNTARFSGYFGLDSSQRQFRQDLPSWVSMGEADITLMAKRSSVRWSAGMRATVDQPDYQAGTFLVEGWPKSDSLLQGGFSWVRSGRVTTYARIQWPKGRKGEWQFAAAIGYGSLGYRDQGSARSVAQPVFRLLGVYSHAWSPLKQFSLQVQSGRDLPAKDFFHPSSLLSGHATVLDGTRELPFPLTHVATATFSFNNLPKGRSWVFLATGGVADRQFNTGQLWDPAYVILYPWVSDGNVNASVQVRGEQYVKSLRSKLSFQLSQLYMRQDLAFNDDPGINRLNTSRLQGGWISAFRGIVNMEISMTAWYTRNQTIPEKGSASDLSQWQYQGQAKLRARFSEKLYATCHFNGFVLLTDNYFQSLDLYLKWSLSSAWSITIYGHNLLGSKQIEQRQFSPNSQTVQSFQLVGRYLLARVQWQF